MNCLWVNNYFFQTNPYWDVLKVSLQHILWVVLTSHKCYCSFWKNNKIPLHYPMCLETRCWWIAGSQILEKTKWWSSFSAIVPCVWFKGRSHSNYTVLTSSYSIMGMVTLPMGAKPVLWCQPRHTADIAWLSQQLLWLSRTWARGAERSCTDIELHDWEYSPETLPFPRSL